MNKLIIVSLITSIIINIFLTYYIYKYKNSIKDLKKRFIEKHNELKFILFYDRVTKLYSYLRFVQLVNNHINNIMRKRGMATMIMLDIKNLDRINTEHGYYETNKILKEISKAILKDKPEEVNTIVSRPGGSEFLIFVYHTSKEDTIDYCESICDDLTRIGQRNGIILNYRMGCAMLHGVKLSLKNLETLADNALQHCNINQYIIYENTPGNLIKSGPNKELDK